LFAGTSVALRHAQLNSIRMLRRDRDAMWEPVRIRYRSPTMSARIFSLCGLVEERGEYDIDAAFPYSLQSAITRAITTYPFG
jgi:hypothetical protein